MFNRLCDAFSTAKGTIPTEFECREELEKLIEETLIRRDKLFTNSRMEQNLEIYTKTESSKHRYSMFHTDNVRHLLSTGGRQMTVHLDEKKNIHHLVPEENNTSTSDGSVSELVERNPGNIYHIAREMVNILQYVASSVAHIVHEEVMKLLRKKKKVVVVEWVEDNIHRKLHLDGGMKYIADILKRMSTSYADNSGLPMREDRYDHYNRGWMMIQMVFNASVMLEDEHLTDINYLTHHLSAEKILTYMFREMGMTVVLMSATAGSKSLSTNFNLDYLRSELAGGLVFIPREVIRSFEKAMERYLPSQAERPVICRPLPVSTFVSDNTNTSATFPQGAEDLFPSDNKDIGKKFLRHLANMIAYHFTSGGVDGEKSVQYYISQYYNFFHSYKAFMDDKRLQSGLCLCERLPKSRNAENHILWSKEILSQGAALIDGRIRLEQDYEFMHLPPNMKDTLFFISSSNYGTETDALLKAWQSGERYMAVSSYKTIGAGMNLAYTIPEGFPFTGHKLPYMSGTPDSEVKKDIDCMVLMDVTGFRQFGMVPRTFDGEDKLPIYRYITHLLALMYSGRMSYFDVSREISNVIAKNASLYKNSFNGLTKDLDEYRLYKIIQALGRISRSTVKGQATLVLYDISLSTAIARADDGLSYTYELRCLREHIRQVLTECELKTMQRKADIRLADEWLILAGNARDRIRSQVTVALAKYLSLDSDISQHVLRMQKTVEKMKDMLCRYPTLPEYPENPELSPYIGLYLALGGTDLHYSVRFKQGYDMVAEKIAKGIVSGEGITIVSEDETYLPLLVRNEQVYQWFRTCGAAVRWQPGQYMLAPYPALSTYKGAIGELAFAGVMKAVFGMDLQKLTGTLYEVGDWMTPDGHILFDVKNFNPDKVSFSVERDLMPNLRHKVVKSGKKLVVVNMLYKDDDTYYDDGNPEGIVFINGLINARTGQLIPKSLNCLAQLLDNNNNIKQEKNEQKEREQGREDYDKQAGL